MLLPVPNPASDLVRFTTNSLQRIALIDVTGRIVQEGMSDQTFDVSALPNGLYQAKRTDGSAVPLLVLH